MKKLLQVLYRCYFLTVSLPLLTGLAVSARAELLSSQDLLTNDPPQFSGLALEVVPYAKLSDHRILSTYSPSHDRRLYTSSAGGQISVLDPYQNKTGQPFQAEPSLWFDVSSQVDLNFDSGGHGGLRSFAFHPEFESNGKFYVSAMVNRPEDRSTLNYLGTSQVNPRIRADSALVEFTFDHSSEQVVAGSARELFRIAIPVYDHPIKQIKFDPFAEPGDENYGLLFVNHGDSSVQAASDGGGLNVDDGLGKVLRINPLATDTTSYSIPTTNPFADATDGTLPEIFAWGFRNPHNLSFAALPDGGSQLLVADIGRAHVEEINLVEAGRNYGWSRREGPLVHLQEFDGSFGNGSAPLPDDEVTQNGAMGFVYPATMFDHRLVQESVAVAGGHVVQNGGPLAGQYFFAEFGSTGMLFHASFDELKSATTSLDITDTSRDQPSELTYAAPLQATLNYDDDNDPTTPAQSYQLSTDMMDQRRSDLRFGRGHLGELYLTSKQTGIVYLVENSMPLPGDVDFDGAVQFKDFLILSNNFNSPGDWWQGDLDGSGEVQFEDFLILSENFGKSSLTSAAVPEPSTTAGLVLGFLAMLARRRPTR